MKIFRVAAVVFLAVSIVLSCTVVGNKLTDPATYSNTIETLDKSTTTVLGLSAASAVASASISALPDDICSSIADEIDDFTTWFLLILSIIYMEKYLLTILGAAACYILIPAGCGALLINQFFRSPVLRSIGVKVLTLAIAFVLVIPSGVWVSNQVNSIYETSIQYTIDSANAASDSLVSTYADGGDNEKSVIDRASELIGNLSGSVVSIVQQFKTLVNRFIEATAVMLVTSCIIPIAVILFYAWIVKMIFGVQVIVSPNLTKPMRKFKPVHREREEEYSLSTR